MTSGGVRVAVDRPGTWFSLQDWQAARMFEDRVSTCT